LNRVLDLEAVEQSGVDHHALGDVGVGRLVDVSARDDLDDRQAELLRELPVALVVRGDGHDRAGAVAHQHVVRHPDRDFPPGRGVDRAHAVDFDAGLLLVELGALEVRLVRGELAVERDLLEVSNLPAVALDQRMLRRHDHVGRAEQRVRPGCEHAQRVPGRERKVDLRALGAADPVALLHLDLLDEVELVEAVEQFLRVVGDAQHPLALDLAHDLAAATLADAADDLLVRKAHLAARAPVDRHLHLVGEAGLVELQEDPLRPLVVLRVGRRDLAVVVEREPEPLQLRAESLHVFFRDDRRVDAVLDRVVLGRQPERVVADREQHVVALHAPLARDDVHRGVRARVADVQPRPGRVRELDQRIELRPLVRFVRGERVDFVPVPLPLLFDCARGIRGDVVHGNTSFPKIGALRQRDGRRTHLSRYHSCWPKAHSTPCNGGKPPSENMDAPGRVPPAAPPPRTDRRLSERARKAYCFRSQHSDYSRSAADMSSGAC